MKQEKKRKSGVKRWAVVCIPALALLLVVNFLACNVFFDLLNIVMPGGGMRAQYDPEIGAVYPSDYGSKEEALQHANELNVRLCEEGMVLLKNDNGALPLKTPESDGSVNAKPKISVFGKNSVNIAYGGSGSGGADTASAVDLYAALAAAGYDCNPVLKAFYEDDAKSGPARKGNSTDLDSGGESGELMCYAGGKTVSVAKDAARVVVLDDGSAAFKLEDVVYNDRRGIQEGSLYVMKDGKGERIADDVYTSSIAYLDARRVVYISDGDLFVWNGKDSEKLASDAAYFWTNGQADRRTYFCS